MNLPTDLGEQTKLLAETEATSVSAVVTEALRRYLRLKQRHELGNRVLALVGSTSVGPDALALLDQERRDARA